MLGGVKNSHRSAADRQGASCQSSYFFAALIFAHSLFGRSEFWLCLPRSFCAFSSEQPGPQA